MGAPGKAGSIFYSQYVLILSKICSFSISISMANLPLMLTIQAADNFEALLASFIKKLAESAGLFYAVYIYAVYFIRIIAEALSQNSLLCFSAYST
jgi:hypothetical protein